MGEQRRQPAPHLKPKPAKKKKGLADRGRANHRPPRLPEPKKPANKAAPPPAPPKQGTPLAAKQEAEAARAAEVAARMRAAEAARGPRPMRRRSRGDKDTGSDAPSLRLPVRPDLNPEAIPNKSEVTPTEAKKPVRPARASGRSDAGRFRMPRATMNQAPVVRMQGAPKTEQNTSEGEPTEPPPRQRSMPSIGGGGMDDLFGAAAQMGRVSLRPKSTEEEEEPK